jgi:hypothetical protein
MKPEKRINTKTRPNPTGPTSVFAAPSTDVATAPPRKVTQTLKLGEIVAESSGSPFDLPKRMPGWRSDCVEEFNGRNCGLFIEELIGWKNSSGSSAAYPIPFQVEFNDNNPFSWLGGSIPDPKPGPDAAWINLIRGVAALARNYNATLYSVRRLHYFDKYERDDMLPNPNGPPDPDLKKLSKSDFADWAKIAERRWLKAARKLDAYLHSPPFSRPILADMIEVNGYIVSFRLIAKNEGRLLEIDGSSSQVSLSSAFSYSSDSSE